jgi:hypothetical protein
MLKNIVATHNDAFFLEHNIFDAIGGKKKANHFKKLWLSGLLADDDKETVWAWIDSFVVISDRYTKLTTGN